MVGAMAGRSASSAAQIARLSAVGGGSVVTGVAAHVVAGGRVPDSCLLMLVVGMVASLATGAASCCAQRTRGPWAALGMLGLGQAAITVALAMPGADHTPLWTLPSAGLHVAATAGLGVLLLGTERVLAGIARLADIVVPRRCNGRYPLPPARSWVPTELLAAERALPRFGDRTLRGPPALA